LPTLPLAQIATWWECYIFERGPFIYVEVHSIYLSIHFMAY
jgi:hypothetical protein